MNTFLNIETIGVNFSVKGVGSMKKLFDFSYLMDRKAVIGE